MAFTFGLLALTVLSFSGYSLARSEITGHAIHSTGPRGAIKEHVTKERDPVKFREVIDQGWFVIIVAGGFAWVCFYFFQKLS